MADKKSIKQFKLNQLFFGLVNIVLFLIFYIYCVLYFKEMPDVIIFGGLLILGVSNRQLLWFSPDNLIYFEEGTYPIMRTKIYYITWPIVLVALYLPISNPNNSIFTSNAQNMTAPLLWIILSFLGFKLNRFLQLNLRWVFKPLKELSSKYIKTVSAVFVFYIFVAGIYSIFYRLALFNDPKSFEKANSSLDMFYFSIVTLTSLGYGDITPKTNLVKSIAISEILVGQIIIVGIFTMIVIALSNSNKE